VSDRPHTDLPLAEIIGWTNDGPDGYGSTWWISPDCERMRLDDPPQPTVDDLLDWLACDVYFQAQIARFDGAWHVDFHHTDAGLDGEHVQAETLLAALEAAVRLVSGG